MAFFIFELDRKFLIAFMVLLTFKILMVFYFDNNGEILAYKLVRLLLIASAFAFVYSLSPKIEIILLSCSLIVLYSVYLFMDYLQQRSPNYGII